MPGTSSRGWATGSGCSGGDPGCSRFEAVPQAVPQAEELIEKADLNSLYYDLSLGDQVAMRKKSVDPGVPQLGAGGFVGVPYGPGPIAGPLGFQGDPGESKGRF